MAMSNSDRKVSYYYEPDIGNFYYGQGHPMKPHRVRIAHSLVVRYDLFKFMNIYQPMLASLDSMTAFHTTDYVEFLAQVTPDNMDQFAGELRRFTRTAGMDCPVFEDLFKYCQIYVGGSLGAATQLNHGVADVAINWAGGLHHAKKAEASGFCYINDIVLSILELLKYHARVLYVDIDVHHGDGVEEAFLATDRVLTLSFHRHGSNFFPGTGDVTDVGVGCGRGYSINVPLKDGMDDACYEALFVPIVVAAVERYRPQAVVLQSGADSLTGDKLGVFNLSMRCHARCHALLRSLGLPLLVLGGGGYKIKNVARCWAYETGVLLGQGECMSGALPPNDYYEYFAPDYQLHIPVRPMTNRNDPARLAQIRTTVLENIRKISPPGLAPHERAPDILSEAALDAMLHAMGGPRADKATRDVKPADSSQGDMEASADRASLDPLGLPADELLHAAKKEPYADARCLGMSAAPSAAHLSCYNGH